VVRMWMPVLNAVASSHTRDICESLTDKREARSVTAHVARALRGATRTHTALGDYFFALISASRFCRYSSYSFFSAGSFGDP
jgi:hypothetical protein